MSDESETSYKFSAGQGVFLFSERMESASGSDYIRFDL